MFTHYKTKQMINRNRDHDLPTILVHFILHFFSRHYSGINILYHVHKAVHRSRSVVRIAEPLQAFLLNTICSSNEFGPFAKPQGIM